METGESGTFPGKYKPTWYSLNQYRAPDWSLDAKFGIFLHWGIYAVPAYDNEWYPRNIYIRDSRVFDYHLKHFGPQSIFGYRSEEHTSELQSRPHLVCRLLLEKKK